MKGPTAAEKRHWSRIAELGCLVCKRPAEIHHVTGYFDRMGRAPRRHDRVVPLCPSHHRITYDAQWSVEALGHRGFFNEYGIDLLAEAKRLWADSQRRAA